MIRLPGLIDIHAHMRTPGQTHKEDFDTGTAAALAGGYTALLSMPNTDPPLTNEANLSLAKEAAKNMARCDYGIYAAGSNDNSDTVASLAPNVCGLKMYLDSTFGTLLLEDGRAIEALVRNWPKDKIIVSHSEGAGSRSIGYMLYIAGIHGQKLHIAHVSTKDEILLIKAAKELGFNVTCETGSHFLYFSTEDHDKVGAGFFESRPRIGTPEDRAALWENIDIIDCFANDHAPHIPSEKKDGMPGYPGLETSLAVYLSFVRDGRLTIEELTKRMHTNPKKIFNLPDQEDTFIEVDENETWVARAADMYTKCGWTPFEGMTLQGKVKRVTLRGQVAFEDGKVLAQPGSGRDMMP